MYPRRKEVLLSYFYLKYSKHTIGHNQKLDIAKNVSVIGLMQRNDDNDGANVLNNSFFFGLTPSEAAGLTETHIKIFLI